MAEHGSSLYTRNPMSTGKCDEWRLFAPDGRFFTGGVALAIFQTPFLPPHYCEVSGEQYMPLEVNQ